MNAVVASGADTLSFLKSFGVEWDLLISQGLMFVLLSVFLYYFLFKPVMRTADERRAIIEKGLSDAKESEEHLKRCQKECEEKIAQAALEASKIFAKTGEDAKAMIEKATLEASEKSANMIAQAQSEIQAERAKMQAELKVEIANLVVETAKSVLGEVLDDKSRAKIAEKAADKIASEK